MRFDIPIFIILLSIIFLNGCLKVPKTAAYYTYHKNLSGLKQFHENGGNLSHDIVDGNAFHGHALCVAVNESIYYGNNYTFNKKNRDIVDYLLKNGITTQNVKCKPSFYDDRVFDLFNFSLLSPDREIIKKLIDNNVTINNFNLPHIRLSFTNEILRKDVNTPCGLKQYVCENQKFAKEYFNKLQRKREQKEQQIIEQKKNEEIDKLLGL